MIKIDVVGSEGGELRDLLSNVHQALNELRLEAVVNEVTNVNEIADKYGMVVTPALFINGKLDCQGHVKDVKQIKECLKGAA